MIYLFNDKRIFSFRNTKYGDRQFDYTYRYGLQ